MMQCHPYFYTNKINKKTVANYRPVGIRESSITRRVTATAVRPMPSTHPPCHGGDPNRA